MKSNKKNILSKIVDSIEHAQYHVDIDLNQANIVKL